MNSEVLSRLYELISPTKRDLFDSVARERTNYVTVVLEDIVKEFNSSAVMRSCDCFGVQELNIIAENQAFEVRRDIAKGSGSWVTVNTYSGNESPGIKCIENLKSRGFKIISTSPHAEKSIEEISIDQPIAVVFGTEKYGISDSIIAHSDELVKIPMYGFTESFNISVSVALILNQLRNRLNASDFNWKLNAEEQTLLKIKWCTKFIRKGERVEAEIRRRILEKE